MNPEPHRFCIELSVGNTPAPGRGVRRAVQPSMRLILLVGLGIIVVLLQISGWLIAQRAASPAAGTVASDPLPDPTRLPGAVKALQRKIDALAPKGVFVVIDTAANQVMLRRGEETLRSMIASCGSGNVLDDPAGGRSWTFETPRGSFSVQSKVKNPLWMKPDWAYIEEGEAIPRKPAERAQAGMLGDYAVGIGQGYFIHGTLYKRLLGRNVSHGCVRLGDADLAALVKQVPLGSRVIIY